MHRQCLRRHQDAQPGRDHDEEGVTPCSSPAALPYCPAVTFSIVGRSPDGSQLGVAVASKFLAVGAFVPGAHVGLGAIATQSFLNPRYLPDGFDLLAQGLDASAVLDRLTGDDPGAASRQAGIVDHHGGSATFTGTDCIGWAGGRTGPGYAVQGNCLAGEEVVDAMERSFLAGDPDVPLARRCWTPSLRATRQAGTGAAGRARRCSSSARQAATRAATTCSWTSARTTPPRRCPSSPACSSCTTWTPAGPTPRRCCPSRAPSPRGPRLPDHAGPPGDDLSDELFAWAGWENVEERHVPGAIDPVVLAVLRTAAARVAAAP